MKLAGYGRKFPCYSTFKAPSAVSDFIDSQYSTAVICSHICYCVITNVNCQDGDCPNCMPISQTHPSFTVLMATGESLSQPDFSRLSTVAWLGSCYARGQVVRMATPNRNYELNWNFYSFSFYLVQKKIKFSKRKKYFFLNSNYLFGRPLDSEARGGFTTRPPPSTRPATPPSVK
jgi:hypothetical protein